MNDKLVDTDPETCDVTTITTIGLPVNSPRKEIIMKMTSRFGKANAPSAYTKKKDNCVMPPYIYSGSANRF